MFGLPRWKPGFQFTQPSSGRHESKVPRSMWMDEVRRGYASDRLKPEASTARELRDAVCRSLGLDPSKTKNVLFYSTLGTPLDLHEGIDGLMEVEIPPQAGVHAPPSRSTITLDVATHAKIGQVLKADLLVVIPDYGIATGRQASAAIYGDHIAEKLRAGMTATEMQRLGIVIPEPKKPTGTRRISRQ